MLAYDQNDPTLTTTPDMPQRDRTAYEQSIGSAAGNGLSAIATEYTRWM